MIGVVVCTHGPLAVALVDTVNLIVGEFPNIAPVGLAGGDAPEEVVNRLRQAIGLVDGGSGVLILCDMFGGTPSNLSLSFLGEKVEVVTGVSLPMLLKLFTTRDAPLPEVDQSICDHARQSTLVAGSLLKPSRKGSAS